MQEKNYQQLLFDFTESKVFKAALFSIAGTTVLGNTIIAPSLPALEDHFSYLGTAAQTLSKLILTTPALILIFFSPIAGIIFEKFNRLKIIYLALILWSIAGASGFFLDNIYLILFSRAVLGVATSFLMTGVGILLGDYYSGNRREKAIALQTFFMAFGGAIFLILGGYLANLNWKYPFLVYLLGFLILLFATLNLFEPIRHTHHIQKSSTTSFDFKKFILIYFLAIFSMICFYIAPTQIPFFMIHNLGMRQSSIGISMATFSIAMAMGSLFYNQTRKIFNLQEIFFIAFSFTGIGFGAISLLHNFIGVTIGFVCLGLALGFLTINNNAWLFMIATESERPRAYGFLASCMFAGQFLSPLFSQALVSQIGLLNTISSVSLACFAICFIFYLKNIKKATINEG